MKISLKILTRRSLINTYDTLKIVLYRNYQERRFFKFLLNTK